MPIKVIWAAILISGVIVGWMTISHMEAHDPKGVPERQVIYAALLLVGAVAAVLVGVAGLVIP